MVFHVIEDDPAVADALVVMLREFGHEAAAYPDAESFLATGMPLSADTVVVDLLLPGMSGADLVRELHNGGSTARIIIITGQAQTRLEQQISGLGVRHLIRKPVEADALRDLI
ncbi:response regulator [Microbaculum marinum]|uniref:Response regulator n=1 Tax=Microbaculum marinum TaxID=1764581 RepID=A0AAW9RGH6_9HYPH